MSPLKDPLDPVKENIGSGTGMGTLTPTCRKQFRFNVFPPLSFHKWELCKTIPLDPKLLG